MTKNTKASKIPGYFKQNRNHFEQVVRRRLDGQKRLNWGVPMKMRHTNVIEKKMVTALNGTKQFGDNAPSKKPDGIRGKEEARRVYTAGGTNMKCG